MIKKSKNQSRVFVGMSGGVDSSVSAALLKRAGYEVIGVFIRVWEPAEGEAGYRCTWRAERRDAMRVAATLDIPLLTLDLRDEYKREVVDYMLTEYAAGRTPNPDVMCNKYVKFGGFYDWAMSKGADFVATGHYAQTKDGKLFVSKDGNKDQTYFLWTLGTSQLEHTLFPIGGYKKSEVRKLAEKFRLPVAEKKDSQGLCFIGKIDVKDFLKKHLSARSGKVLDEQGEVIGEHDGAALYTIGERHGFTVKSRNDNNQPLYVVAKDLKNNTITVSPKGHQSTSVLSNAEPINSARLIKIRQVNWITQRPTIGQKYLARVRYRQSLVPCVLTSSTEEVAEINFLVDPDYPASGQSLVLYGNRGGECLGGGVIV